MRTIRSTIRTRISPRVENILSKSFAGRTPLQTLEAKYKVRLAHKKCARGSLYFSYQCYKLLLLNIFGVIRSIMFNEWPLDSKISAK